MVAVRVVTGGIKLQACVDSEDSSQLGVEWRRTIRRAVLKDHCAGLGNRHQSRVVRYIALDVPSVGQGLERFGSGAEVNVCISQIESGGAVKLTSAIFTEIDV